MTLCRDHVNILWVRRPRNPVQRSPSWVPRPRHIARAIPWVRIRVRWRPRGGPGRARGGSKGVGNGLARFYCARILSPSICLRSQNVGVSGAFTILYNSLHPFVNLYIHLYPLGSHCGRSRGLGGFGGARHKSGGPFVSPCGGFLSEVGPWVFLGEVWSGWVPLRPRERFGGLWVALHYVGAVLAVFWPLTNPALALCRVCFLPLCEVCGLVFAGGVWSGWSL